MKNIFTFYKFKTTYEYFVFSKQTVDHLVLKP